MKKLVIGVWQGRCVDGDVEANIARTEQVIQEASRAGCDFVCLPELFLSGAGDRAMHQRCAMALDDPRLVRLARSAGGRGVVAIVGFTQRRGKRLAVSQAVLARGRVAGHYTKTMPTEQDWALMGFHDDKLPVFKAKGITFGVIICHDSSFPEVAATLAWKGARVIFSPHFNYLPRQRMDDHRVLVRNNHVGIAAHYNVIVARSNVVGYRAQTRFLRLRRQRHFRAQRRRSGGGRTLQRETYSPRYRAVPVRCRLAQPKRTAPCDNKGTVARGTVRVEETRVGTGKSQKGRKGTCRPCCNAVISNCGSL